MILLDQDGEDCQSIKKRLVKKCKKLDASKKWMIRIACHELESWYFGDIQATSRALQKPELIRCKNKRKYRIPDEIKNPAKELEKITGGTYQKVGGSRSIGRELSTELKANRSHSFRIFAKAIQNISLYRRRQLKINS